MLATGGTARPILDRLNAEIARVLAQPDVRERLAGQRADARTMTVGAFAAFLRDESAKWTQVARAAAQGGLWRE